MLQSRGTTAMQNSNFKKYFTYFECLKVKIKKVIVAKIDFFIRAKSVQKFKLIGGV